MYRIVFDPKKSKWIVQLQVLFLFWSSIQEAEFPVYSDAKNWVENTGLPNVYRNWNDSAAREIWLGNAR